MKDCKIYKDMLSNVLDNIIKPVFMHFVEKIQDNKIKEEIKNILSVVTDKICNPVFMGVTEN